MDDQIKDSNPPASVSQPEEPCQGVTVVEGSAPNEARAPLPPTEEEKSRENEDEQQRPSSGKTPSQLIREIRDRLDQLWEAQKESIIATIKNEPLDRDYERTRKERREHLAEIRNDAEQFWRQSGFLKKWIRNLTREEDGGLLDFRHKFPFVEDGHEEEKFKDLCRWLEKKGLADRPGCYCFKDDLEFVYIGRADVLISRIRQHEKSRYFTYSNAIRIVIPRDRRKLEELERLLILAHPTKENQISGTRGGTPLDDLLRFLEREVEELIEDAPLRN